MLGYTINLHSGEVNQNQELIVFPGEEGSQEEADKKTTVHLKQDVLEKIKIRNQQETREQKLVRKAGAMAPTAAQFSKASHFHSGRKWFNWRGGPITGNDQVALIVEPDVDLEIRAYDFNQNYDLDAEVIKKIKKLKREIEGASSHAERIQKESEYKTFLESNDPFERFKGKDKSFHPGVVMHVMHQIAPRAQIIKISPDKIYPKLMLQEDKEIKAIEEASVVNMSYGSILLARNINELSQSMLEKISSMQEHQKDIIKVLEQKGKKLFVIAAGNINLNLSEKLTSTGNTWKTYRFDSDAKNFLADKSLSDTPIIIVGGLNPSFTRWGISNYPGKDTIIQKNFLCTLGNKIAVMWDKNLFSETLFPDTNKRSYIQYVGTSLSAPIITGCALLIKEGFPDFKPQHIKEVLLGSASQEFVIRNNTDKEYIFYYDSEDKEPDPSKLANLEKQLNKKQDSNNKWKVKSKRFDPFYYGRGVLDLENAFIYAALLKIELDSMKENPLYQRKSSEELRRKMKENLHVEQERAHNIIAKTWRERRALKSATEGKPQLFQ